MTILITGGAGFIGSFLARALIKRGEKILVIDNFDEYYDKRAKLLNLDLIRISTGQEPKHFENSTIKPIYDKLQEYTAFPKTKQGEFKFIECDVRDYEKLKEIFAKEKIEKIMHLAAMAGVPYSLEKPRLYTEVNINGTVNLLDLSVKNKVQNFVFASSSSIYGGRTEIPFKETDDVTKPISPYAATKRMGEIICYTYSYLHKIPITIARIFGPVYGPLQRPYGMAAQRFIRQTHQGKEMTIYGDGEMGRDSTYIDDEVNGLIKCLDKNMEYEIVNIGTGKPITVIELAEEIKKLVGKGDWIHIEKPLTEVPITYADITKAKEKLEYEPKIEFTEGIKRQYEIFKIMPEWYKEIKG